MSEIKMMTPLFMDGRYNRECRQMRAVFVKTVSDRSISYQIWRKAGPPEIESIEDDDQYILHVKLNKYLVPLQRTEFQINRDIGSQPEQWTTYISKILAYHVGYYRKSKESNGQQPPDYIGACVMNELDECMKLAEIYRRNVCLEEKKRHEEEAIAASRHRDEVNALAKKTADTAIEIIKRGGRLKNDSITFYSGEHRHDESLILYLMRQHGVSVPLRTQGWIRVKLVSVIIENGRCENLQYLKSKGTVCSQRFFDCMNELIERVKENNNA